MKSAWPQDLIALFEIAGRETTAELFKIAAPIAAGNTKTAIITTAPAWLRKAIPGLADDDADRVAVLLTWGMYLAHTCTTRELCRKWKIGRTLGLDDTATIDFALAEGAELAEQRFVAWATNMPVGDTSPMTQRFMSALAERIATRIRARQHQQEEGGNDFSDCT
jgi:hypothetical protein